MKGRLLLLAIFLSVWSSCGDAPSEPAEKHDTAILQQESELPLLEPPAVPDSVIRRFLVSVPGTYGWETKADDISLDFLPDGRLHIQGPDGEATMWQGSWMLKDNMLLMDRPDLGHQHELRVVLDGDRLMLGERVYTRYRP